LKYQATWIYNKRSFLEDLRENMQKEKDLLIQELKTNDNKLKLISMPFGGYRNILEVDDLHFEDNILKPEYKQMLKVSAMEEQFNSKFNAVTNTIGMKNTRWGRLTITLYGIWAMLTCVTCF